MAVPAAGVALAAGLIVGGVAVPALAGALARTVGRRQVAARGELTAELVEALQGAPELVVYRRECETIARIRDADAHLARLGRRDALVAGLADALSVLVAGMTVAAVLAVAITAHDADALDRVLVATLALLAIASSLPQGLDTIVGEAGSRLSGGQRQRLVLARALLAERPVLVLDEPTAHLDAASAEQLMNDVLDAAGDRTVLLITHRAEGLDRMDEIVRLD